MPQARPGRVFRNGTFAGVPTSDAFAAAAIQENPVPGPEPMDIVSADYLRVDDDNSECLQALGIMNDTDDAFAFYAISTLPADKQPKWLSVRNASEPQINVPPFPAGTSPTQVNKLKGLAGAIYGVYPYCTTINSAFACWGIVAEM